MDTYGYKPDPTVWQGSDIAAGCCTVNDLARPKPVPPPTAQTRPTDEALPPLDAKPEDLRARLLAGVLADLEKAGPAAITALRVCSPAAYAKVLDLLVAPLNDKNGNAPTIVFNTALPKTPLDELPPGFQDLHCTVTHDADVQPQPYTTARPLRDPLVLAPHGYDAPEPG